MLLFRPARGGTVSRQKLEFRSFEDGHWIELLESAACAEKAQGDLQFSGKMRRAAAEAQSAWQFQLASEEFLICVRKGRRKLSRISSPSCKSLGLSKPDGGRWRGRRGRHSPVAKLWFPSSALCQPKLSGGDCHVDRRCRGARSDLPERVTQHIPQGERSKATSLKPFFFAFGQHGALDAT